MIRRALVLALSVTFVYLLLLASAFAVGILVHNIVLFFSWGWDGIG